MFFKEDEINEDLFCSKCSQKFVDPRILPCGQTYCNLCVFGDDDDLKCPNCGSTHQIPKDTGFPPNLVVAKLVQKSPGDVYRGKDAVKLQESLNRLHSDIKDFEEKNMGSVDLIKNYCSTLKNEVDLVTESNILVLQNTREDFINKIKAYETSCIENFENNSARTNEFVELINETKRFYSEWSRYLKEFKIDDERAKKAIEESEKKIALVAENSSRLKEFVFNGSLMKFKSSALSIGPKFIGEFVFEKFQPDSNSVFRKINLKNTIMSSIRRLMDIEQGSIEYLASDKYFIAFLDEDGFTNIFTADQKGNLVKNRTIDYRSSCLRTCASMNVVFLMTTLNDARIRFRSTNVSFINAFDVNLEILNSNALEVNGFLAMAADQSFCYVLKENSKSEKKITVFDHNLYPVTECSLQTMQLESFQLQNIQESIAYKNFLYLLNGNGNMVIFNIVDGKLFKTFKLADGINCFAIFEDEIYALDRDQQKLIVYDEDGKFLKKVQLNFSPPVGHVLCNSEKLAFFDSENLVLYSK